MNSPVRPLGRASWGGLQLVLEALGRSEPLQVVEAVVVSAGSSSSEDTR